MAATLTPLYLASVVELGGHLERQLAGGAEDERAHRLLARGNLLQQGQAERGRLAGAGLAADDEVLALHDRAEGLGLDGGGVGVAALGDAARGGSREVQVVEADVGDVFLRGGRGSSAWSRGGSGSEDVAHQAGA